MSDLLGGQYFVVHIIQGTTVSHVECPKQSVSLFLYLLCLERPNICLLLRHGQNKSSIIKLH